MRLASLETTDTRAFDVRVAGPAALLIAKVHKIEDRGGTGRQSDKDALDVYRLLRGIETDEIARRYLKLLADKRSSEVAKKGLELFTAQFSTRDGIGIEMAIRSAGMLADEEEIAASCEVLARDFIDAISSLA